MSENIKNLMGETLEKIKATASADTIIGEPIKLSDTVSCIPVSKVSYGFASGGSDFGGNQKQPKVLFAGGGGAGMTVTPIAFLVLENGKVKIVPVEDTSTQFEKIVNALPDAYDKLSEVITKHKKDKAEKE